MVLRLVELLEAKLIADDFKDEIPIETLIRLLVYMIFCILYGKNVDVIFNTLGLHTTENAVEKTFLLFEHFI